MTTRYPPAMVGRLRQVAAATFTRTLTVRRGATSATAACSLMPRSGRLEEAGAAVQTRGDYTLTVAYDDPIALLPDERVTVDSAPGQIFRVVWVEPLPSLAIRRRYGLVEVR